MGDILFKSPVIYFLNSGEKDLKIELGQGFSGTDFSLKAHDQNKVFSSSVEAKFECVPAHRDQDDCYQTKVASAQTANQKNTLTQTGDTHVSGCQPKRGISAQNALYSLQSLHMQECDSKTPGTESGQGSPGSSKSSEKENEVSSRSRGDCDVISNIDEVHDLEPELSYQNKLAQCCFTTADSQDVHWHAGNSSMSPICDLVCSEKPVPNFLSGLPTTAREPCNKPSEVGGNCESDRIANIQERDCNCGKSTAAVDQKKGVRSNDSSGIFEVDTCTITLNDTTLHKRCHSPPLFAQRRIFTPMSCDENFVSSTNEQKAPDRSKLVKSPRYKLEIIGKQQKLLCDGLEVNSTTLSQCDGSKDSIDESDIEIDVIRVDDVHDILGSLGKERCSSPVVEFLGETGPTMPLRHVTPSVQTQVELSPTQDVVTTSNIECNMNTILPNSDNAPDSSLDFGSSSSKEPAPKQPIKDYLPIEGVTKKNPVPSVTSYPYKRSLYSGKQKNIDKVHPVSQSQNITHVGKGLTSGCDEHEPVLDKQGQNTGNLLYKASPKTSSQCFKSGKNMENMCIKYTSTTLPNVSKASFISNSNLKNANILKEPRVISSTLESDQSIKCLPTLPSKGSKPELGTYRSFSPMKKAFENGAIHETFVMLSSPRSTSCSSSSSTSSASAMEASNNVHHPHSHLHENLHHRHHHHTLISSRSTSSSRSSSNMSLDGCRFDLSHGDSVPSSTQSSLEQCGSDNVQVNNHNENHNEMVKDGEFFSHDTSNKEMSSNIQIFNDKPGTNLIPSPCQSYSTTYTPLRQSHYLSQFSKPSVAFPAASRFSQTSSPAESSSSSASFTSSTLYLNTVKEKPTCFDLKKDSLDEGDRDLICASVGAEKDKLKEFNSVTVLNRKAQTLIENSHEQQKIKGTLINKRGENTDQKGNLNNLSTKNTNDLKQLVPGEEISIKKDERGLSSGRKNMNKNTNSGLDKRNRGKLFHSGHNMVRDKPSNHIKINACGTHPFHLENNNPKNQRIFKHNSHGGEDGRIEDYKDCHRAMYNKAHTEMDAAEMACLVKQSAMSHKFLESSISPTPSMHSDTVSSQSLSLDMVSLSSRQSSKPTIISKLSPGLQILSEVASTSDPLATDSYTTSYHLQTTKNGCSRDIRETPTFETHDFSRSRDVLSKSSCSSKLSSQLLTSGHALSATKGSFFSDCHADSAIKLSTQSKSLSLSSSIQVSSSVSTLSQAGSSSMSATLRTKTNVSFSSTATISSTQASYENIDKFYKKSILQDYSKRNQDSEEKSKIPKSSVEETTVSRKERDVLPSKRHRTAASDLPDSLSPKAAASKHSLSAINLAPKFQKVSSKNKRKKKNINQKTKCQLIDGGNKVISSNKNQHLLLLPSLSLSSTNLPSKYKKVSPKNESKKENTDKKSKCQPIVHAMPAISQNEHQNPSLLLPLSPSSSLTDSREEKNSSKTESKKEETSHKNTLPSDHAKSQNKVHQPSVLLPPSLSSSTSLPSKLKKLPSKRESKARLVAKKSACLSISQNEDQQTSHLPILSQTIKNPCQSLSSMPSDSNALLSPPSSLLIPRSLSPPVLEVGPSDLPPREKDALDSFPPKIEPQLFCGEGQGNRRLHSNTTTDSLVLNQEPPSLKEKPLLLSLSSLSSDSSSSLSLASHHVKSETQFEAHKKSMEDVKLSKNVNTFRSTASACTTSSQSPSSSPSVSASSPTPVIALTRLTAAELWKSGHTQCNMKQSKQAGRNSLSPASTVSKESHIAPSSTTTPSNKPSSVAPVAFVTSMSEAEKILTGNYQGCGAIATAPDNKPLSAMFSLLPPSIAKVKYSGQHHSVSFPTGIEQVSAPAVCSSRKLINCKTRPFPSKVNRPKKPPLSALNLPSSHNKSGSKIESVSVPKQASRVKTSPVLNNQKIEKLKERKQKSKRNQIKRTQKTSIKKALPSKTSNSGKQAANTTSRKDVLDKINHQPEQGITKPKDEISLSAKSIEKRQKEEKLLPNNKTKSSVAVDSHNASSNDSVSTKWNKSVYNSQPKKNVGLIKNLVSECTENKTEGLSLFKSFEGQAQQAKAKRKKDSAKGGTPSKLPCASKGISEENWQQNPPLGRYSRSSGRLSAASISSTESSIVFSKRSIKSMSNENGSSAKRLKRAQTSSSGERKGDGKQTSKKHENVQKEGTDSLFRRKAKTKPAAASKRSGFFDGSVKCQWEEFGNTPASKKSQKRKVKASAEEMDKKKKSSPLKKELKQEQLPKKEKKKAARKKPPSKLKKKKRKMVSSTENDDSDENWKDESDEESNLDDFVDSINNNATEDSAGDESEEWDLPDGVQYDDTPCSAPKCKNPVGERVDW
ncbi:hypothetical protein PoB_002727500, partial [Plakobranchus ocellatus]